MTVIDGSYGEGGGQILRTALALAAITGEPVEIANIRAGRTKPGLQPQHLAAVRAAGTICAARLEGDAVGSQRLLFEPRAAPAPGPYRFEIGTAGAATLVAQTVALPLALARGPSHVTVVGGTHVPHAPPFEYLAGAYAAVLERHGAALAFSAEAHGFYPRGGGRVQGAIAGGAALQPIDMTERGGLESLTAWVVTSNLPGHVADRGATTVERYMKGIGRPVAVERRDLPSPGTGAAVVLVAECEGGIAGFTGLGERGKPMEKVAEAPSAEFLAWWKSGAAVDAHLADQLVLPAALTPGESRWTTPAVTEHIRTVLWVVRRMLPAEAAVEERPGGPALVVVRGGR